MPLLTWLTREEDIEATKRAAGVCSRSLPAWRAAGPFSFHARRSIASSSAAVRERSPPRDDPAHHDRREGRLAERHRQSHSEFSGAFHFVLNWRPSHPVDAVE